MRSLGGEVNDDILEYLRPDLKDEVVFVDLARIYAVSILLRGNTGDA